MRTTTRRNGHEANDRYERNGGGGCDYDGFLRDLIQRGRWQPLFKDLLEVFPLFEELVLVTLLNIGKLSTDPEGWMSVGWKQMRTWTGLSQEEQEEAIDALCERGVLQVKETRSRRMYRVKLKRLRRLIEEET